MDRASTHLYVYRAQGYRCLKPGGGPDAPSGAVARRNLLITPGIGMTLVSQQQAAKVIIPLGGKTATYPNPIEAALLPDMPDVQLRLQDVHCAILGQHRLQKSISSDTMST